MVIKLGELEATMSGDVKKTDEVKVSLKVGLSNKLETARFKPSEDIKKGDKVKITVEKL
jgi:hypothetical protein